MTNHNHHLCHNYNLTAAGLLGDKLSYLPGVPQEPLYDRRPDNGETFFVDDGEIFSDNSEICPDNGEIFPDNGEIFPDNGEIFPDNGEIFPDNSEIFPHIFLLIFLSVPPIKIMFRPRASVRATGRLAEQNAVWISSGRGGDQTSVGHTSRWKAQVGASNSC